MWLTVAWFRSTAPTKLQTFDQSRRSGKNQVSKCIINISFQEQHQTSTSLRVHVDYRQYCNRHDRRGTISNHSGRTQLTVAHNRSSSKWRGRRWVFGRSQPVCLNSLDARGLTCSIVSWIGTFWHAKVCFNCSCLTWNGQIPVQWNLKTRVCGWLVFQLQPLHLNVQKTRLFGIRTWFWRVTKK